MNKSIVALLLISVTLLAACTTYRGVPLNQIPQRVSPGDSVRVTTRVGEKFEFEVTGVGDEELTGGGVTKRFADLALVEKRGRQRVTPEVVLGWVVLPLLGFGLLVVLV